MALELICHDGLALVMGRRKVERQDALFVTADALPKSPGPPFYRALNRLPAEAGFDRWVEERSTSTRR